MPQDARLLSQVERDTAQNMRSFHRGDSMTADEGHLRSVDMVPSGNVPGSGS